MTSICPWNNYESGTRLSVSVFGYLVKCCSSTARADRAEFVTGAGNHIPGILLLRPSRGWSSVSTSVRVRVN